MAHDKPLRPQDALGPEVLLERKAGDYSLWASNMLKEIGKELCKQAGTNQEYRGSIAIHVCSTSDSLVVLTPEMNVVQQWEVEGIADSAVNAALAMTVNEWQRILGRPMKTRDPLDKRGDTPV